jgi:hypothetical protein
MIAAPAVSGAAAQGTTLSTSNGRWSGTTPLTLHYGWQRCDTAGANCVDIAGANGTHYILTSGDVGHTVRSAVSAVNSAGSSTAYSAATAVVASRAPVNAVLPTISGTAQAGQTLTASTGAWSGPGSIGFTYQWARCDAQGLGCAPISGALTQTYTLTNVDVGHALIVQVRAANVYGPGYADSKPTGVVATAGVLTLRASHRVVLYGSFATLIGTVPAGQAGQAVTIVATPVTKSVAAQTFSVTLANGGAYELVVQPKVRTSYRAQAAGVQSASQTVYVQPRVRLGRVSRNVVAIHVYETNPLGRHTALVQFWSARRHRWLTLQQRAVLHSTRLVVRPTIVSMATYRVHGLGRGTRLRAYVTAAQAGPGYVAGTSNSIRL